MPNILTLIAGVKTVISSLISSTGVNDADKIISTNNQGKIDISLVPDTIAKIADITNTQQYGKFTGLKSNYYLLGTDINIMPVYGGQSGIQSYWGLQLGGIRPGHRFGTGFIEKDPPDIYSIEDPDSFCVAIQAQTSNPNNDFIFSGMGQSKPFSVLNLYGTNWHTNGYFLNCKTANYNSVFNINLNGEIYIQGNKILGIRNTGWMNSTGTANKGTFDTTSATTQQCAERIKALEDMLRNHGLIN